MSEIIAVCFGIFLGFTWAFTHVTEDQWTQAQEMCKVNGGMKQYISQTVGSPAITCNNGAKFSVKEAKE